MSDSSVPGLVRCGWADLRPGPYTAMYRSYHDHEWGRPLHGGWHCSNG